MKLAMVSFLIVLTNSALIALVFGGLGGESWREKWDYIKAGAMMGIPVALIALLVGG